MTAAILNSSHAAIYPSAFQWIEKPLYYLNGQRNKSNLSFSKFLVIQYLSWPIIMCATPFTASVDIGVGICEAFYAKYKGATSHQIILIIQKKMIASPIQHLTYVITNLIIPLLMGIALFACASFNLSLIPIVVACTVAIAPMMASLNYYLAQQVIGQKLPAWARPEGFNIFINGGCLDPDGNKITDEDYDEEVKFHEWKRKQASKLNQEGHREFLCKNLQDKASIVNAYQNNKFKSFFHRFLKAASASDLLELKPSFSKEELGKAYRKWSLILHPDKHTEKGIKEVAEILFKSVLCPARLELEKNLR